MKTRLFILLALIFSINISAQEQKGWEVDHHEGDELRKVQEYDSYMFTDENDNTFVYWSNSNDNFRIILSRGIFDYDTSVYGRNVYRRVKNVTVGYYDENGKLIDSGKTVMDAQDGQAGQAENPYSKTGKKVIKYLEQNKGYVRIVAPVYGSNVPFDIKVPCRTKD